MRLMTTAGLFSSRQLATGKEIVEHHDNGSRQQEMDEPSQRETDKETGQPQSDQYERNCVQHIIFLFFLLFYHMHATTWASF
jgi:hypothetical protein